MIAQVLAPVRLMPDTAQIVVAAILALAGLAVLAYVFTKPKP